MQERLYHQAQNTFGIELSTSVHNSASIPAVSAHFHKNYEILTVIDGSCDCSINAQSYHLERGDSIFICPFQIHGFCVNEGSSVRRVTFHEHLILTISQSLDGRKPKDPVFHANGSLTDFFLRLISSLFGEDLTSFERVSPYQTRIQLKGLLYLIGGDFLSSAELISTPKADTITTDIAQYISENFKKNISLQDVAKEKGYNYQYISRVFNQTMGMNFKKMLNQFRLEHAYAMLQDTNLSVSRICFESGFQSLRSFNQICMDTFKKTPKELRKGRNNVI